QLSGAAAVAADHAENRGADRSRVLQRAHHVDADLSIGIATTDREHEHGVSWTEPALGAPRGEHRVEPLALGPRGHLRRVVGRGSGGKRWAAGGGGAAPPPTARRKSRPPRAGTAASADTSRSTAAASIDWAILAVSSRCVLTKPAVIAPALRRQCRAAASTCA